MRALTQFEPRRFSVRLARLLALLFLALIALAWSRAEAAAPVMVDAAAMLSWSPPLAAAGDAPLTAYQVLVRDMPISDADGSSPDVVVGGSVTAATWKGLVQNGGTIYVRVRACNIGGCGPLSAQASKQFSIAAPGAPGQVQVTITFTVSP